jgi:hypothetical protein
MILLIFKYLKPIAVLCSLGVHAIKLAVGGFLDYLLSSCDFS